MKICKIIAFIATCVWSFPALAGNFGYLESWVGSYPTRETNGKTEHLLSDRNLKASLNRILDKGDISKLDSYDQALPIKNIDGFIVVNTCKPKNCAPQRSLLVFDTKSERIWVGFFERFSAKVVTRWYGNIDDYYYIPEKILSSFSDKQYE